MKNFVQNFSDNDVFPYIALEGCLCLIIYPETMTTVDMSHVELINDILDTTRVAIYSYITLKKKIGVM